MLIIGRRWLLTSSRLSAALFPSLQDQYFNLNSTPTRLSNSMTSFSERMINDPSSIAIPRVQLSLSRETVIDQKEDQKIDIAECLSSVEEVEDEDHRILPRKPTASEKKRKRMERRKVTREMRFLQRKETREQQTSKRKEETRATDQKNISSYFLHNGKSFDRSTLICDR